MLMRLARRHKGENGYVLVTAILILAIMSLFMLVTLSAGTQVNQLAERGNRWTRSLSTAEGGLDTAISAITYSRATTTLGCPVLAPTTAVPNPTVCSGDSGDYQVSWSTSNSTTTITSVGYYPADACSGGATTCTLPTGHLWTARKVQAIYQPAPSFQYALFSATSMNIKNNETVFGSMFANGDIQVQNNATICGSIVSSGGGVSFGSGAITEKSGTRGSGSSLETCSNQKGDVYSGGMYGGSGAGISGGTIAGDAKASAPSAVTCSGQGANYSISGSTVAGAATACGNVTGGSAASSSPNTATTAATSQSLPSFSFDPNNYPGLICFPASTPCGASTATSSSAVANWNSAYASASTLSGTYAVWQTSPTSSTQISLDNLQYLNGDFTLITNAPVTFGNGTHPTFTSSSSTGHLFVVISTYPGDATCDTNSPSGCSIYAKNAVNFDPGTGSDLSDGIVALLYTSGYMAVKNNANSEGALYANLLDLKNGYDITYNSRISRILGFGAALVRTSWLELTPPTRP